MKNSIGRLLYHKYITIIYPSMSYRGGWMLTHEYISDYKKFGLKKIIQIIKCHIKGWSFSDWTVLNINGKNRKSYLSTLQYVKMHPFNAEYSSWIDDKLTLKYIISGTCISDSMPNYYFHILSNGSIVPLMDCPSQFRSATISDIIHLLKEQGDLALKLMKGSMGQGFYHLSISDDTVIVNGSEMDINSFKIFISELSGYIITEYLKPHPILARYNNKTPGCLRYIYGKKKDGEWVNIYTFMRIGTVKSNNVENFHAGGILMEINKDGNYNGGLLLDMETMKPISLTRHPDNNIDLIGTIPFWNKIENIAYKVVEIMPQLSYIAFDFCVTNMNEVKIIEINSLSSLDGFQMSRSILESPGGDFFKERLQK